MIMSTPGHRRDEELPGIGETTDRRQRGSSARKRTKPRSKRRARMRGPFRTLTALGVLVVLLFGGIGAAFAWGSPRGELSPQLGLDLAGGRQIVIAPITEEGQSVNNEQLDQAIDIIRQRVDGGGVSEAEISRLGSNISVAIPGNPTPDQLEALSRSSQMQFRPVLVSAPVLPPGEEQPEMQQPRNLPLPPSLLQEQVEQLQEPPAEEGGDDAPEPGADDAPEPGSDEAEETDENRGGEAPNAGAAGTGALNTGATEAPAVPEDAESTEPAEEPAEPEQPAASNPSDLNQITPELQEEFTAAECDGELAGAAAAAPGDQPIVACNTEGAEKYILGPVELTGGNLTDATARVEQLQGGASTGRWEVVLTFDDEGRSTFSDVTTRLMGYDPGSDQNRFAMVLDGGVISAPTVNNVISDGIATISGNFTPDQAQTLADQLRFGALPLSFDVQTSEQISPTLGGEQLRWGIVAGAVGLLLVFVFMLFQYNALGLVAIGSLILASALAYGAVTFLGWATNFRLTMAGVTGLIISIGIVADSFIVYFERIRDEVRAGRPLRYAVDTGWARARRTLIISDVVNLIAAAVLYFLSEAGVAAFAFMLGVTTIIDLIVVFMFTHPVVSILANTTYFGEGKKWSGMEPERLGASRAAYLGRGRVREPDVIAPSRRRHTREELEGGVV